MKEYDYRLVAELPTISHFVDHPVESICPACGEQAVRTYIYRNIETRRVTRIIYTWCAASRHFKGWTGPDIGDFNFSDPLESMSPQERDILESNLDKFFDTLDTLWESGTLPQKFFRTTTPKSDHRRG